MVASNRLWALVCLCLQKNAWIYMFSWSSRMPLVQWDPSHPKNPMHFWNHPCWALSVATTDQTSSICSQQCESLCDCHSHRMASLHPLPFLLFSFSLRLSHRWSAAHSRKAIYVHFPSLPVLVTTAFCFSSFLSICLSRRFLFFDLDAGITEISHRRS